MSKNINAFSVENPVNSVWTGQYQQQHHALVIKHRNALHEFVANKLQSISAWSRFSVLKPVAGGGMCVYTEFLVQAQEGNVNCFYFQVKILNR